MDSVRVVFDTVLVPIAVLARDTIRQPVLNSTSPSIPDWLEAFGAVAAIFTATWIVLRSKDEDKAKARELRALTDQVNIMMASRRAEVQPRFVFAGVENSTSGIKLNFRNAGREAREFAIGGHELDPGEFENEESVIGPGSTAVVSVSLNPSRGGEFEHIKFNLIFEDVDGRYYEQEATWHIWLSQVELAAVPTPIFDPLDRDYGAPQPNRLATSYWAVGGGQKPTRYDLVDGAWVKNENAQWGKD